MRILAAGSADDVRGFALAGIEGRVVEDPAAVRALLEELGRESENVGLVLLCGQAARYAQEALGQRRRWEPPPAVLLFPETSE